jgi:pyruvate dehydrogenase E2 component (dihydrolipoamide acetyltransferase)
VGVAVDTENGLVVPVIRGADSKGLFELAGLLEDLSTRARDRKLRPQDLQGGSFSISSLGGIGGTFFTPIVNHPEVAILGVSRMEWKPVFQDGAFVPRLILPLSLSYDHRVIDGADAVRFTSRLTVLLADLRRLLL